jgi:L-cystine uptake protein TcyP (sodium:dicarboxylate symporter family)
VSEAAPQRRRFTLTQQILVGLVLGVIAGAIVNAYDPDWANYFRPFSQLFLRLIKMIVAPLIFTTLVGDWARAICARSGASACAPSSISRSSRRSRS